MKETAAKWEGERRRFAASEQEWEKARVEGEREIAGLMQARVSAAGACTKTWENESCHLS